MNKQWLGRLIGGMVVAAIWGCGAEQSGDGDSVRTTASELSSWAWGNFSQVLRVNPGETTVRNICELTIPLSAPKPLTILASESTGQPQTSLTWTGGAVSVAGGLSVTGCTSYPCEVIARWRTTSLNGSALGCEVIADDGISRLVGTSSGTALTVNGPPSAAVIFNQDAKIGEWGTSTATARSCVMRQNALLPNAQVTNLQVVVNGAAEVNLPGPIPIGNVPWSTLGPQVTFGALYVGSESIGTSGATRLKHVTARKEQVAQSDSVYCSGVFESQSGTPVFGVNNTTGTGLSLALALSGWTCSIPSFGSGDGCDCSCGIPDPDCEVPCSANETDTAVEADFCNLQFPASLDLGPSESSGPIYGRIYELGVTEAGGSPPGVIAEVGWGPANVNPTTQSGWQFFPANYNVQVGNDDEFMGSFTAPSSNGDYRYTFRFSVDGTWWTYCDLDGAGSNGALTFDPAQLGVLTVSDAANETDLPAEADFCNLQWPLSLELPVSSASPLIFGRIYEAGLTDVFGPPPGVIAEVGWGPANVNPLVQSGWQFFPANFNIQVGNDDEFMGSFTVPAVPGEYRYTYRFSLDGTLWTYCDLDGAGSNGGLTFDPAQLGVLMVSP